MSDFRPELAATSFGARDFTTTGGGAWDDMDSGDLADLKVRVGGPNASLDAGLNPIHYQFDASDSAEEVFIMFAKDDGGATATTNRLVVPAGSIREYPCYGLEEDDLAIRTATAQRVRVSGWYSQGRS